MKKIISCFIATLSIIIFWACSKNDVIEPPGVEPPAAGAPNIIFIVADDLGWDVFGNYPNITGTKASTPTIDSLAKNGITFTNFWVNPECAPSRAAMLSGKNGFRTGVGSAQCNSALATTETIIHKYINDKTSNAYATASIGKWHISPQNQLSGPENFGIQYYSGFLPAAISDYYNWTETSGGKQQTLQLMPQLNLLINRPLG
jgi:arylsulfatase B